jgi:hypothetical protein
VQDSEENYVSVGGYILWCRAAMLSACYPDGVPVCQSKCLSGATRASTDPPSEPDLGVQ